MKKTLDTREEVQLFIVELSRGVELLTKAAQEGKPGAERSVDSPAARYYERAAIFLNLQSYQTLNKQKLGDFLLDRIFYGDKHEYATYAPDVFAIFDHTLKIDIPSKLRKMERLNSTRPKVCAPFWSRGVACGCGTTP